MSRTISTLGMGPLVGGLALGAALCQFGCDGWVLAEEAPKPPVDGSPFSLRIITTQECSRPPELPSEKRLLGVEVEVTGWADSGVPANFYYARLEDGEGHRYESVPGCEPALAGPPLRPGNRARGYLTFAVPTRERSYQLVYAPRLLGGRTVEVSRELSSARPGETEHR